MSMEYHNISLKGLVIIPAFNEEKNISLVLDEVKMHLVGFDCVVIDDGSTDTTVDIVTSKGIPVISHPINFGYGATVQTGFKFAAKKEYDIVLLMDADGQHDAKYGPALIHLLENLHADMVIGSRYLAKTRYKTSFTRIVGKNLFSFITYVITRKSLIDITSGFQALNRRAVTFLSKNYPVDFPDAEVIIMMLLNGFKIAEAPSTFRQRQAGHSMFTLSKILYYPFKVFLAICIITMREYLKKER